MSHDDFEFEPVRGLPAALPEGEALLWQGSPDWKSLAVHAYHVRKVAAYFGVLSAWRVGVGLTDGHTGTTILLSCLFLAALGGVAVGVLSLLAFLNARSTVYSITSRRVLLRHGVAVPLTMNVPFKRIDQAAVHNFRDGTGDISLSVLAADRVGYLISWPHVRPGKFKHPQPSFRTLRDVAHVASLLSTALAADCGQEAVTTERASQPAAGATVPAAGPTVRPATSGGLVAGPRTAAVA